MILLTASLGLAAVLQQTTGQVGCATAVCLESEFNYYYVCHYCPAGNYRNSMKTPYTAGPVCGDCPKSCDNGLCANPCKFVDVYSNCPALKMFPGCTHLLAKKNCPASCLCTTEIK